MRDKIVRTIYIFLSFFHSTVISFRHIALYWYIALKLTTLTICNGRWMICLRNILICLILFNLSQISIASYTAVDNLLPVEKLTWDQSMKAEDKKQLNHYLAQFEHNQQQQVEQLKVLWWNIEGGATSSRILKRMKKGSTAPLDHNLQTLINSKLAPDILIFGEYYRGAISKQTHQMLKGAGYIFDALLPYSHKHTTFGIKVFSKKQFDVTTQSVLLDWTPPSFNTKEKEIYRKFWHSHTRKSKEYKRAYHRITVVENGRPIHIVPAHLINPWREVLTLYRDFFKLNSTFSKVMTTLNIEMDHYGPLVNQIRYFKQAVLDDLDYLNRQEAVMLIGDFNIPNSLSLEPLVQKYFLSPIGYKLLKEHFLDAFNDFPSTQRSFPAYSSNKWDKLPSVKIDHSFVTPNLSVKNALVLALQGSDHYPIFVSLKL